MQIPMTKVRLILNNPDHLEFFIFAERLFSRVMNKRQAFDYVSREDFYKNWPAIKERVAKDAWAVNQLNFWQNVYSSWKHPTGIKRVKVKKLPKPKRFHPRSQKLAKMKGLNGENT